MPLTGHGTRSPSKMRPAVSGFLFAYTEIFVMSEEAYNRIHGAENGRFTFTTRSGRDAFVRRCEKYDADYEVQDHKVNGEWDTATVSVASDDLRPLRYLIKT